MRLASSATISSALLADGVVRRSNRCAVSAPVDEIEAGCNEPVTTAFAQAPVAVQAYRHVTFDTIVVHGIPPMAEDA